MGDNRVHKIDVRNNAQDKETRKKKEKRCRRDSYRPAKRERVTPKKKQVPQHTTPLRSTAARHITGGGKTEGVPTVVFANPRHSS
jgi:hypothetical protein